MVKFESHGKGGLYLDFVIGWVRPKDSKSFCQRKIDKTKTCTKNYVFEILSKILYVCFYLDSVEIIELILIQCLTILGKKGLN